DRPQRGGGGDRPSWQDRKPAGDRPQRGGGGDRPSWQDRKPAGDRPQRGGGDRPQRSGGGDRPSWQDRKPAGDRPQRSGGDRPSWQDRRPDRAAGRPTGGPDWQERRPDRSGAADRPSWQDRRPARAEVPSDDAGRRPAGPELPEWADVRELDPAVRAALRGLDSRNSDVVGQHLVAAGGLLEEDPELALQHARAARDRASRLAVVREAVGVAAYHAADFAEAARELRAYARMTGDQGYRAVLADCERALGRPETALRLVQEALETSPEGDELVELQLVEAGARQDMGEERAAVLVLEGALGGRPTPADLGAADLGRLRLATAYADLLADRGDEDVAQQWYAAIAAADPDDLTGVSAHFAEDPEDEAAADPVPADAAEELGADEGEPADGERVDGEPADLTSTPEDEPFDEEMLAAVSGPVTEADIEAEVAELLGETPPPVERDHTRLFQEPPGTPDEQDRLTD
ncbi:hypothetical protein ACI8AH_12145, partial [Modestobacter sp. SYSU DS0903]